MFNKLTRKKFVTVSVDDEESSKTNAPEDIFKINCKGIKPNWNFVIPINEIDANVALKGKNNPNPTQSVKIPSPIDKYSE